VHRENEKGLGFRAGLWQSFTKVSVRNTTEQNRAKSKALGTVFVFAPRLIIYKLQMLPGSGKQKPRPPPRPSLNNVQDFSATILLK